MRHRTNFFVIISAEDGERPPTPMDIQNSIDEYNTESLFNESSQILLDMDSQVPQHRIRCNPFGPLQNQASVKALSPNVNHVTDSAFQPSSQTVAPGTPFPTQYNPTPSADPNAELLDVLNQLNTSVQLSNILKEKTNNLLKENTNCLRSLQSFMTSSQTPAHSMGHPASPMSSQSLFYSAPSTPLSVTPRIVAATPSRSGLSSTQCSTLLELYPDLADIPLENYDITMIQLTQVSQSQECQTRARLFLRLLRLIFSEETLENNSTIGGAASKNKLNREKVDWAKKVLFHFRPAEPTESLEGVWAKVKNTVNTQLTNLYKKLQVQAYPAIQPMANQ